MLYRFKSVIINNLKSEQDSKNKALIKPVQIKSKGIIYVIRASNKSEVKKIGKAKSWKKRFDNYNIGRYENVDLLLVYEFNDIDKLEKCLKVMLSEYKAKKNTELYDVDLDVIKKYLDGCSHTINVVDNKKKYKLPQNISDTTDKLTKKTYLTVYVDK